MDIKLYYKKEKIKNIFCALLLFHSTYALAESEQRVKILHLTFHKGCVQEINGIAKAFDFDLETWYIPHLPSLFLDGVSRGNVLYNIGHQRAENIWNRHKETFLQFDAILVSDTAPLSRIFLQNHFPKPLIIWVCNRFDYSDQASLDCHFPDPEFYELFDQACHQQNITIIAYTAFEQYYARKKGINIGSLLITPCGSWMPSLPSAIPAKIDKASTFFLPPYHNERIFMNLSACCEELGIPTYCGNYQGAMDLKDFKGIIHLPYSWSNLAFFENIALGIPYFIPSLNFCKELMKKNNYFHPNLSLLMKDQLFELSEWYKPEREQVIIYFDSWEDLKMKINTTDYTSQRKKIEEYAQHYRLEMLARWKDVFDKIKSH